MSFYKGKFVLYQSSPEEESVVALITHTWSDGMYGIYMFHGDVGPTHIRAVSPDLLSDTPNEMSGELQFLIPAIGRLGERITLLEALNAPKDAPKEVTAPPEPESDGVESTSKKKWPRS